MNIFYLFTNDRREINRSSEKLKISRMDENFHLF